jgi:hypothetical protein
VGEAGQNDSHCPKFAVACTLSQGEKLHVR